MRVAAKAWPAAVPSTACGSCAVAWTGGATGSGTRCARPPRRCRATSRGSTTLRGPEGSSSARSSSHLMWAWVAVTSVTSPYGGPQVSLARTAVASLGASVRRAARRARSWNSSVSEPTALTGSWVGGSPASPRICCRRPGDVPAVASETVGPRPVGEGAPAVGASRSRAVRIRRSASSSPRPGRGRAATPRRGAGRPPRRGRPRRRSSDRAAFRTRSRPVPPRGLPRSAA